MNILITGGNGFIGTNFIKRINSENTFNKIINLDNNSYSSNLNNLKDLNNKNYFAIEDDIKNHTTVKNLLNEYDINLVVHFAAESHVDKSITNPDQFIQTNIVGTYTLVEECRKYIDINSNKNFKFIHVSTDEVYGSLKKLDRSFLETDPYLPNSPYAASKASSDLIVRSYYQTYKFPAIITNCSNNYGPFQYPEKLVPLVINNCLIEKRIPIYGDGKQIRDWLHVDDHCDALLHLIQGGQIGEKYNIGGGKEIENLELVKLICKTMDEIKPRKDGKYEELISFVKDRPGHDRRYSINHTKIMNELNWKPSIKFDLGMRETILWYLENQRWIDNTTNENYNYWIKNNYEDR